ncbi:MAG TPA: ABC transporter permease [Acetobacteraceae bacterium]|nr:ABC transporter permease [Acetobacteraceae bacterium]
MSPARSALCVLVGLVLFFLALPILIVFPLSVSSAPYLQFPPPGFSWQWFGRYFGDPDWIDATIRSLQIASATAILALALGIPLAWSLARGRYPGRAIIERLMVAPMIVPAIIFSVAIYGLFAKLKLIGAWYGLAIAHTILALPFVVILVRAGLTGLDRNLEAAAEGLGAGRLVIFRRIVLPQIAPSLISAALLAFITSFDELVVALFLAGSQMTLPKKMFDNILIEIDPTIAAVSVLQILMIAVALALAARFGRAAQDLQIR